MMKKNIISSKAALALVNTLFFVFSFTVLSGILLMTATSNTRLVERSIRRVKGQYASEAGLVTLFENARTTGITNGTTTNVPVNWTFGTSGTPVATKVASTTVTAGVGPYGTTKINSTCNYTLNW